MQVSTQHHKILLIGAGKMGSALLQAWLRAGVDAQSVAVIEPDAPAVTEDVKVFTSLQEITTVPACVILAVKPQSLDSLLPELAEKFGSVPLYISIAAGKTTKYYEKYFGGAAIVRAMPNTPALISKGISALYANAKAGEVHKQMAASLLKAAGDVVWIDDESQMDAVTAISGSGPAYAFLFMEALIEAGVEQGLPQDVATQLAIETVHGAAELARKTGEPLATLRKNVTSPGGTTQAALEVLMKKDDLKALIAKAVKSAVKRAKELA
jgi:pyrroline-5-carboxylate reductase